MRVLSLLPVVLVLGSASARADAPVDHYLFREEGVSSSAYASDECGYWSLHAWAFESVRRSEPGAPEQAALAHLSFSRFSYCTGITTYGDVDVPLSDDIDLRGLVLPFSIALSNTLYTQDEYGNAVVEELPASTLTGNVTFTGEGPIESFKQRQFLTSDGLTQVTLRRGQERTGTAVFELVLDGQELSTPPQPAQFSSARAGELTSMRLPEFHPAALRPRGIPGGPSAGSLIHESGGAMLSLWHDDAPGCRANDLSMSAFVTNDLVLPEGGATSTNQAWLQFAQRDSCDPERFDELRFNVVIPDVVSFADPLESVAVELDQVVTATRCSYTAEGGGCEETSVRLSGGVLWQGSELLQGGRSSATYRVDGGSLRAEAAGYLRLATVSIQLSLDGEPLSLVAPDYASVQSYRSVDTFTPD